MKAIIKEDKNIGLSLKNIKTPKVGKGNILVKVKACSICGGDNYLYKWNKIMDNWDIPLPLIIGHEICGDVVSISKESKNYYLNFKVGDRISVDSHIYCNQCSQCLNNKRHNCENLKILGIHADGGFAEYVNIPAQIAFKIPDEISYDEGALLEPFGVGVKAFYLSKASLTDRVAIFGGGPIGLFISKLSVLSGIKNTFVFEPNIYRRELARKLGIKECYNPLEDEEMNLIKKRFDIIFEVSGTSEGLQLALSYSRKDGKVIIVGAQQDKVLIDVKNEIMTKELTLKGTFGRLIWETWYKMMELLKNKQIDLKEFITHRFDFNEYKEAFSISLSGNCGKVIMVP
ncbi:MAG: alcohol dehydrogenase catalytic domain-containing protein [Actinobacteria bacterium]|nr:alcohol dehydrogenase catalytic domain-containing protein [Actinomycetota bacterium]